MSQSALARRVNVLLSGDFRKLAYVAANKLRGVDLSPAQPEDYGLDSSLAVHHSNSGGPVLESVVSEISVPANSRIVDFGSGKGGACLSLAKFPFEEVLGIELSPEMVNIAKSNAAKLGSHAKFACGDAAQFTDLDRFTHCYFYNPSALPIIKAVYRNLLASLDRAPRKLTLLCKYADSEAVERFFPESARLKMKRKIERNLSEPFFVFELS